jgi:archaellum biogenesis ATPase FlaH/5S rRNA maturation endonuclease (ribonuclease M5)
MLIPRELIIEAKEKYGEKAAFVIAKDLELKEFDETHLKAICPFHDESEGSLVYNQKDNAFKCFGCQKVYGILDHYMIFYKLTFLDAVERLFNETGISFRFGERGVKTQREYVYPHEEVSDRTKVEEYCGTRCISPATLDFGDVSSDENGNIAFHYYDLNDILCMVKYRASRKVEKGEKFKFWTQKDSDTLPLLYGMNKVDPTKPLLCVEGELDRLSVIECSHKNVVSIPLGAGNTQWIEHNWDWLEQFQEIIIWSDNDKVGVDMRKEVCSRLGVWRTKYVDLPTQLEKDGKMVKVKDANEVLFHFGKQKVIDLINNAQEIPVQNVVDLADVDDFDIESAPGLFTSLKNLNDVVYKFIYGSLVILTGKRGSGKSVFLNQAFVCDALESGEDVFIYSGELGTSVLKNWIETPLIGRENITMKNEFVRKFDEKARKEMRDWYKGRIWAYDDLNNDIEQILNRAISITRKFGAKVWIIDNLMSLDIGITGDGNQWIKQKELVVKLVSLALTYNVLIVLVSHPRKQGTGYETSTRLTADDVAGSSDIGNICHYILSVHRYTKKERVGEMDKKGGYKEGKEPIKHDVVIDVLKNRYTGKIEEAKEYFCYQSYRFYDTPKTLWHRYGWNKDTSPLRTDDPNHHNDTPDAFGDD